MQEEISTKKHTTQHTTMALILTKSQSERVKKRHTEHK